MRGLSGGDLSSGSLFYLLLLFTLMLQSEAEDDPNSFPDIFQHMVGKDRFRFYYEVNWFDKNNQSLLRSKLIDESYSFSSNSGRMMVNNGALPTRTGDYSIFYWFSNPKLQEYFWLRPFICPAVRKEASATPPESGLLFEQDLIYQMLSFKGQSSDESRGQFILQGLGALLANTVEHHASNLKRIENSMQVNDGELDDNNQIRWILNTRLGYWLEFNFQKRNPDEQLSFEHLVGLRILVFKSVVKEGFNKPGPKVGQLTVLKATYLFPNSLVRLPKGYSCHHTALKSSVPFKSPSLAADNLTKYTVEVTVTTGGIAPTATEAIQLTDFTKHHLHEPLSVPEPVDSMTGPISNTSILVLIVDRNENSLSIVSRLPVQASKRQKAQLTIWDLSTKQCHKVSTSPQSCEGPIKFNSSLELSAGTGGPKQRVSDKCQDEHLVVKLTENLGIRLTTDGLKWLTFELQNRQHSGELVDFIEISNGEFEINYEAYGRDLNLCLFYLDTGKSLEFTSVRLLTRFWYSAKQNLWSPKSSSLQFFDTSQTQLVTQINIRLAHQALYRPWALSKHHQIDLSACNGGPRQSAKLFLEYPLGPPERYLLSRVEKPHELIRSILFDYLKANYKLTLARVPSIAVSITDELIGVEARILDQTHLLPDSEPLNATTNVTSAHYIAWLASATRSVLMNNLQSCADYCKSYRCQLYVFCKYSFDCYIYSASASNFVALQPPASYFESCSVFRMTSLRDEDQFGGPSFTTWSLDGILESIQQSVNAPIENSNMTSSKSKISLLQSAGIPSPTIQLTTSLKSEETTRPEQTLELTPSFAHYQFDNPSQDFAANTVQNPFFSGGTQKRDGEVEVGITSNFEVVLGGHRLQETNNLNLVEHQNLVQHLDLEETDGLLSANGLTVNECLRFCLASTGCVSVSYCSTNSECLVSRLNRTGLDRLTTEQRWPDRVDLTKEAGGLLSRIALQKDPGCTIIMRTYSDQFERHELRTLSTYSGQPLDDVLSITPAKNSEECATRCALGRLKNSTPLAGDGQSTGCGGTSITCLSYDFCQPISSSDREQPGTSCILYNRHLVSRKKHVKLMQGDHEPEVKKATRSSVGKDILTVLTEKIGSSSDAFCWHYVRNYISDFHKIDARRLPHEMRSLVVRNYDFSEIDREDFGSTESTIEVPTIGGTDISLAHCAGLCEEDPNCGAFEFCALSRRETPGSLYLSCALGANETLAMIQVRQTSTAKRPPQRYVRDMIKLARHRSCSVYVYKALSLVVGYKKKNLHLFGAENIEGPKRNALTNLLFFDLILFCLFFLVGLMVRELNLSQFSFRKLQMSIDEPRGLDENIRESEPGSGPRIRWPARRATASEESTNEFKLKTFEK